MILKLLLLMLSVTSMPIFYPQCIEVEVSLQRKQEEDVFVTKDEKLHDRRSELIYFGYTPVTLIEVASTQITLYQQEYYQLPPHLQACIQKITITSQELNGICQVDTPYVVKGCARSEFNDIYLDENYRSGDLLHESIHLYSYQNNRVFSDVFLAIYNEEGSRIPVQIGNQHNIYEYFVSAYLWYLYKPDDLQRLCPKTNQYFNDCA